MEKTSTIKMQINRFDGKNNFFLWQARVKDVLIQQGLINALLCKEKPSIMKDASRSPVRDGAPDGGGSSTRCDTREDDTRVAKRLPQAGLRSCRTEMGSSGLVRLPCLSIHD